MGDVGCQEMHPDTQNTRVDKILYLVRFCTGSSSIPQKYPATETISVVCEPVVSLC